MHSFTQDQAPSGVPPTAPADLAEVRDIAGAIHQAVASVIEGKSDVIRTALIALLARGHLLVEDVPGVGKTMLAKALSRSIDCSMRRVQFTPDLLPSDVTGVSVYNQDTREFEFRRGAIFAHLVVGDEINRASPKTQSALLECMQETQVTVDGTTYPLPAPFMVMATQNPIEMEGTFPLPEAQRDRFMVRISMGYPTAQAELDMLESHGRGEPVDDLTPVTDADTVRRITAAVREVYTSSALRQYVVDLVSATRTSPALRLGASPRAALHLLHAGQARAALEGRDHVIPEDIQALAPPVLSHRLILSSDVQHLHRHPEEVLADLVTRIRVPTGPRTLP